MAHFFFHIGDGKMVVLKDDTGAHLADPAEAMDQAAVIAWETSRR